MKLQKSKDMALALRNLQSCWGAVGVGGGGAGQGIETSGEKEPAKVDYVPARRMHEVHWFKDIRGSEKPVLLPCKQSKLGSAVRGIPFSQGRWTWPRAGLGAVELPEERHISQTPGCLSARPVWPFNKMFLEQIFWNFGGLWPAVFTSKITWLF